MNNSHIQLAKWKNSQTVANKHPD